MSVREFLSPRTGHSFSYWPLRETRPVSYETLEQAIEDPEATSIVFDHFLYGRSFSEEEEYFPLLYNAFLHRNVMAAKKIIARCIYNGKPFSFDTTMSFDRFKLLRNAVYDLNDKEQRAIGREKKERDMQREKMREFFLSTTFPFLPAYENNDSKSQNITFYILEKLIQVVKADNSLAVLNLLENETFCEKLRDYSSNSCEFEEFTPLLKQLKIAGTYSLRSIRERLEKCGFYTKVTLSWYEQCCAIS